MQEGTILKGTMFNKIYAICMMFYLSSSELFEQTSYTDIHSTNIQKCFISHGGNISCIHTIHLKKKKKKNKKQKKNTLYQMLVRTLAFMSIKSKQYFVYSDALLPQ